MIHLEVDPPAARSREPGPPCLHRVAGVRVVTRRPLAELAAFREPGRPAPASPLAPSEEPSSAVLRPVYRGEGWIGGRVRPVSCCAVAGGYRIELEGIGRFRVAAGGAWGGVEALEAGVAPAVAAEALVGPVLVLALALRGVWCLHASAVAEPERAGAGGGSAVAFLGPSGAGKSTLAERLSAASVPWRRLADDVLPWRPAAGGAVSLPRFPQLKLPPDRQPGAAIPAPVPLRAVYVLERPAGPGGGASLRIREISRRDAALALVRHTVGARLFDRELLARHLEACAGAAGRLRVRRLSYPWSERLPAGLPGALAADLEAA